MLPSFFLVGKTEGLHPPLGDNEVEYSFVHAEKQPCLMGLIGNLTAFKPQFRLMIFYTRWMAMIAK